MDELAEANKDKEAFAAEVQEKKTEIEAQNNAYDAQKTVVAEHKKQWSDFERKDVKQREDLKHNKNLVKKHEKLAGKERKRAAACLRKADECDLARPKLE